MGSIDIFKPLSTVLSRAINKSQQHQDKNSRKCRESNPGLLGEKQVCYLCAIFLHLEHSRRDSFQLRVGQSLQETRKCIKAVIIFHLNSAVIRSRSPNYLWPSSRFLSFDGEPNIWDPSDCMSENFFVYPNYKQEVGEFRLFFFHLDCNWSLSS